VTKHVVIQTNNECVKCFCARLFQAQEPLTGKAASPTADSQMWQIVKMRQNTVTVLNVGICWCNPAGPDQNQCIKFFIVYLLAQIIYCTF